MLNHSTAWSHLGRVSSTHETSFTIKCGCTNIINIEQGDHKIDICRPSKINTVSGNIKFYKMVGWLQILFNLLYLSEYFDPNQAKQ